MKHDRESTGQDRPAAEQDVSRGDTLLGRLAGPLAFLCAVTVVVAVSLDAAAEIAPSAPPFVQAAP
ncbi:MAG: hypothetical protein ABI641_15430 [Caldimonas sp.]